MQNPSTKGNRKPMRQIIILKGEVPGAKFTRKQAAEAVKKVDQDQKLARRRASRQVKFDRKGKGKNQS